MKNKVTQRRLLKDIDHISLADFLSRYIVKTVDEDDNVIYIIKIVRDLSVQREGVWDLPKKMNFINSVVKGNGDNNMLHYVDLEKCRSKAENTGSLNYMKHLAGFISQGAELCHLDGGNRTDAIVGFLTNEIPLKADHYFYGEDENGDTLYFILEVDTYFKDLTEEQKEIILDKGMLVTVIYEDLTQEERAELFKTLNDGVDLNSAEKRNAEVSEICNGIRELNNKYKQLFIDVGALTQKKADRWLFCEYVAKLMNTSNNYLKTETWSWAGSAQIDKDYKSGSDADVSFGSSLKFFEEYLTYIKLIAKMDLKDSELYTSSAYMDLYLLLTYMKKENIKLYELNVNTKKEFLYAFNNEIVKYFGDVDTDYYIKTTKGIKRYEKYAGITTKTTDVCLNARMNKLIKEFISVQLDNKKLVKVTKRATTHIENKMDKASLFMKQKGKPAATNDKIDVFNLNKGTHVDHKIPVRKGGSDKKENKALETSGYNLSKSAKEKVTA